MNIAAPLKPNIRVKFQIKHKSKATATNGQIIQIAKCNSIFKDIVNPQKQINSSQLVKFKSKTHFHQLVKHTKINFILRINTVNKQFLDGSDLGNIPQNIFDITGAGIF